MKCYKSMLFLFCMFLVASVWICVGAQRSLPPTGDKPQSIEVDGQRYTYNTDIQTILFIGLDSPGKLMSYAYYNMAPKADTLMLFILDHSSQTVRILGISRDTMTEVTAYTRNGYNRGCITTHLGYAYSLGDGGAVSCSNIVEAVSNLLGGIPIDYYFVVNRSSIIKGNELVNGVTVTVPNNDLAELYPEMTKGAKVTLTEDNVVDFVRYRVKNQAFSNNGRMARQKAFCMSFVVSLKKYVLSSPLAFWNQLQEFQSYMYTNITLLDCLSLASVLNDLSLDNIYYTSLTGSNVEGDMYDEVWVTQDDILKTTLPLFYVAAD